MHTVGKFEGPYDGVESKFGLQSLSSLGSTTSDIWLITKSDFHVQVGVKNKTNEVQSKLANVILVDVNKNQVYTFFPLEIWFG